MVQMAIYAGIVLAALLTLGLIITRLYRRATKEIGFVRTGFGGERVRIGLLKLFADGALGSGTAAMLEPYEDAPGDRGIATLALDELVELLRRARSGGIGVATHAIGDAAVEQALAAEVHAADAQGGVVDP